MRVILIDDEPIALEILASLLLDYRDVEIVGSYTHPFSALKEIEEVNPDVVFLDIEMGEANGLEIAESFMRNHYDFQIVFVTAYSEYAVDAFEINAIDYLLKPIQNHRLDKTIRRLREREQAGQEENENPDTQSNSLTIQSLSSFQVIDSRGEQIRWRTKKTKELFAYLWMNRGDFVSKTKIVEAIFPDKDFSSAFTLLYTTVYQLRKSLEKLGYKKGINYLNDGYQLKISVKNDLEELNALLDLKEQKDEQVLRIIELYKGGFLEEEGYDWAIEYQQWHKKRVFQVLENYTITNLTQENLITTLEFCLQKMHRMDTFNENVARMFIEYYGKQKDREKLKAFFYYYKKMLLEELNLEPMKSTIHLYKCNMKE